jgi:hypothetical protein
MQLDADIPSLLATVFLLPFLIAKPFTMLLRARGSMLKRHRSVHPSKVVAKYYLRHILYRKYFVRFKWLA